MNYPYVFYDYRGPFVLDLVELSLKELMLEEFIVKELKFQKLMRLEMIF